MKSAINFPLFRSFILLIAFSTVLFACKNQTSEEKTVPIKTVSEVAVSHNHVVHTVASAGCEANSWSPEVFTFYGDGAIINSKLENSEMDLKNRRLYLVAIESENGASIKLFERSKDGSVSVQQWQGNDAGNFISEASKNILVNKGVACVGEQTQALLDKMQPKSLGEIPSPVSAQAAFSHDIKSIVAPYLKVTVFLLC